MTIRCQRTLLVLGLCLVAVFGLPADLHAAEALSLHRGVGIHYALNWAKMKPPPSSQYVFPPFEDAQHRLADADLEAIRAAGFDFVRLTVEPGPFLQFKGAKLKTLIGILLDRVSQVEHAGLDVVVDLHPIKQNKDYQPSALVGRLAPEYRDALVEIAAALAEHNSHHVAFELINEPNLGKNPRADAEWQRELLGFYRAVRAVAPTLPLVLSGNRFGSYEGLIRLDPTAFAQDMNTIFTFHFYLPYIFTGQGKHRRRFLCDVPYPASQAPISVPLHASRQRVNALSLPVMEKAAALVRVNWDLRGYYRKDFDRSDIRAVFDKVGGWASKAGIAPSRILLGEFGALRDTIPSRYRDRWLSDVREEAEQHGFAWSIWSYRNEMTILSRQSPEKIDPGVLTALGLASQTASDRR